MAEVFRVGHITPSSNVAVEPLTYALSRSLGDVVTHHFTRISVTQVALNAASEEQFAMGRLLAAAKLLAEAPIDVIVFNGTSASWRGLAKDLALRDAIAHETGIPATTATIGFYNAFRTYEWTKIALAVPYSQDITRQIEAEYRRHGLEVAGSAYLSISDNAAIGAVEPRDIKALLRDAARSNPSCIAVVCTNLAATGVVSEMEAELGIPIVDSIAVTFWDACRAGGREFPIKGWGCLLEGKSSLR